MYLITCRSFKSILKCFAEELHSDFSWMKSAVDDPASGVKSERSYFCQGNVIMNIKRNISQP